MHYTKFEDILDSFYGKVGTPERDEFERKVAAAVNTYRAREEAKKNRKKSML